ncbi:helix-turn-helix domain-containing protein [Paenibacillus sp. NPDC056579]|uniref:helix-turn-helix transcriptional regulator n=1 Tax=Paenibacillus sp. NPDC056579 TaxID=3345871 RepID=UPI0036A707F5
MKTIEYMNLLHQPFRYNYRISTCGEEWEKFHAHQGIELLYVHEGCGRVVIEHNLYAVASGTLICFQPYQLHRIQMDAQQSAYVRSIFVFDPVFLEPILKPFPELWGFFRRLWTEQLAAPVLTIADGVSGLERLLHSFHDRLSNTPAKMHIEEFLLFTLSYLQFIRAQWEAASPVQQRADLRTTQHTEKIMEWVEQHFREELSLEQLASELHLSSYHISHLFQDHTGFTITDYMIARRLKEACLLLSTTSYSIRDICQNIGLNSDSYFIQLFKKHIGVTPKQYRNAARNVKSAH